MAQNDRVVIGNGYVWKETISESTGKPDLVMVYAPVLNPDRSHQVTPDGGTVVQKQGGCAIGSTGVIKGQPINVHRSYLHGSQSGTAPMGNDMVQLVPVFLDRYQQLGWFPVDHVRIYRGSGS